jgi:hypothetical protein
MNAKGHPASLVPAHPGNLNAVKSGAHSPRLIQVRANEILEGFSINKELDEPGRVVLGEVARLTAIIEAIDRDLDERGITDSKGNERYLLQRRERYARRLLEAHDRFLAAQARASKERFLQPETEVDGSSADYIRHLQGIAFGLDPEARLTDRVSALKTLIDLRTRGETSYYQPKPYEDDPAFQSELARLNERLDEARKVGHLKRIEQEIKLERLAF